MRLSLIRSAVVAIGAAMALAACGGSVVPSQGISVPSNASNAAQFSPLATNPCYTKTYQPAWIFNGSCKIGTLTSRGATLTLPAYKGYSVTVTFPANTCTGSCPYSFSDALDKNGDVLPYNGHPFPKYTAKKVAIYLQSVNLTHKTILLKNGTTLTFVLQNTGRYPGTTCGLSPYTTRGWQSPPLVGQPSHGKLTLRIPASLVQESGGIRPGPLYLAIYC